METVMFFLVDSGRNKGNVQGKETPGDKFNVYRKITRILLVMKLFSIEGRMYQINSRWRQIIAWYHQSSTFRHMKIDIGDVKDRKGLIWFDPNHLTFTFSGSAQVPGVYRSQQSCKLLLISSSPASHTLFITLRWYQQSSSGLCNAEAHWNC